MKIPIIYQDEHMLCVSKPNNTLVHHAHHSRNVSNEKSLLQLLDEQIGGKYYPIHRLDRKTSGIILLAKKTEYVAKFQKLFTNNEIQKNLLRGY
ncbi:pseudouridine synthase [Tenacibaculum maritimum]|uniref:pseudouridine synthase n=1 Tax=Tenacibaculum maritimum TaxID=107401 RepID=UPI0021D2F5D1|nr:pseudouridine synthase [Tenacibaculum maritimum]